jgi:phosphoglycerol transferase MdoB-like AlkP superfamily enzyme
MFRQDQDPCRNPSAHAPEYMPHSLKQSRYALVWIFFILAMLSFTITRTLLILISPPSAELGFMALWRVYLLGALYDATFYIYALLPVSLYLLLAGNRLWKSRFNRVLVHVIGFATVYGLLFIAVAEFLFWREFNARFNFISVDYLVYRREVTDNILQSYPVAAILAVLAILAAIIYRWLFPAIQVATRQRDPMRQRLAVTVLLWIMPLLAYAAISQEPRDSGANVLQNELASDGPYQFFASFRNNELDFPQFYATFEPTAASELLRKEVMQESEQFQTDKLFDLSRTVTPRSGNERRLNIMLIMVESLSAKYMQVFGNQESLTPYLDQLAEDSLLFTRFYATGTRTTRGLEAVTLSIPPTPGRSIVKRLGRESNLWSLGNVLGTHGYDVRFLYGGHSYFDNMEAFFSGNGYRVIDQSAVAEEKIGFSTAWGMADEYLFNQALVSADEAAREGQPFFFHIMTTSNHRPYTYPDNRIDIPSGTGRSGAVKYTDWAIGKFIDQAREHPWFDDTLFVILADHTAGSAGKSALPVEGYHIPLLIHAPKYLQGARIDTLSSQIDVAPTILGLLNMSYQSRGFGKDILEMRAEEGRTLIGNYQHLGLFEHGILSIISPRKRLTRQDYRGGAPTEATPVDTGDPQMRRALAYYQGASYIYSHGLDAWMEPPQGGD